MRKASETNAQDDNPGLHELVEELMEGGFRFDLRPMSEMQDGTSRHVYYGLSVLLDGLAPADLEQLLAIVETSPYDGRIRDGRLVLDAATGREPDTAS